VHAHLRSTPLAWAAKYGQLEMRAHNWLRISPLHEAARKGDVREAKQLLESGADLTARDEHS